jgi:hypothetical protein
LDAAPLRWSSQFAAWRTGRLPRFHRIGKRDNALMNAFPNEKKGMRVKPLPVSRKTTERSGDLPALIPFRRSSRPRPGVPEHLAAQLRNLK